MARGGRRRDRTDPERRCIATGGSGPTAGLIRFVRGPGDVIVPDVSEKLPGRGAWLTADRALVDKAVARNLFARAFRTRVTAPPDLGDMLERLLADRLIGRIAMARKAGHAVTGFEKTRARISGGTAGLLLAASDAAEDGATRLARSAPGVPRVALLDSTELGLAFGRDFAIHAALDREGGFAERALAEARRLAGFRGARDDVTGDMACGPDGRADPNENGKAGPSTGPEQDDA